MRVAARAALLGMGLALAGCAPERQIIVVDAPPIEIAARPPVPPRPPCAACPTVDIPASPGPAATPWALRTGLAGRGVGTAALPPDLRRHPE
jgi:hypothetical protein